VVEGVTGRRQAVGAAPDGHAFPVAVGTAAGFGDAGGVEIDVVGDEDIEQAVAVVVDEGAAGAPAIAGDGKAGARGDVLEFAVAEVAVEGVMAVVSDE
jgi:hypothetical protein